MNVTTGRLNFSASRMRRNALRYPSGCALPKFRWMFSFVSRPFWCADHHAADAVDRRESGGHRAVVPVETIAVQLNEIAERQPQIIQRVGTLDVPRDLHPLPGV